MTTTISTRQVDGLPCVISTETVVRPALAGRAPLTITTGPLAGDTVWLAARECGFPFELRSIAAERTHPEFGLLLTAWIDTNRTDDAPKLRAILGANLRAAVVRDDLPACDNCGDCPRCC